MAADGKTKTTNADFLRYALKRVWMAEGASEEHGDAVADAVLDGDRPLAEGGRGGRFVSAEIR